MRSVEYTPTSLALEFIDRINQADLGGMLLLMSSGHRLEVFDEEPVVGRQANATAWREYLTAFPNYRVYPQRIQVDGNVVAILGYTTGSHLGLPDEQERKLTLIWLVHIEDGKVTRFRLVEDEPSSRDRFGL